MLNASETGADSIPERLRAADHFFDIVKFVFLIFVNLCILYTTILRNSFSGYLVIFDILYCI